MTPTSTPLSKDCQPFYALLRSRVLRPTSAPHPKEAGGGGSTPAQTWGLGPLVHLRPPLPVERNKRLLVWVGRWAGPAQRSKGTCAGSRWQGGDGVWEGLRVYGGRVFKLQEHLQRLEDSAKALAFERVPLFGLHPPGVGCDSRQPTGMRSNAHVRLTLTRGLKVTSGMSPHFNQYGCTLIVLAEWKPPVYDNASGIRLVTASNRRNPPQCLDSKIHHNNLLNNILAKIEGNNAGADDAVMLDINGFVSETNATNMFLVKNGKLLTPGTEHACLPGITRATVLEMAQSLRDPCGGGKHQPIPASQC